VVREHHRPGPGIARGSDSLLHPAQDLRLRRDRQVVGAWLVRAGREGGLVVREGHERYPSLEENRTRGLLQVTAGPSVPDASDLQVGQGVQQPLLLEVEGVVVGQRTGVHARCLENLDGQRVGAEVKDLGGARPRPPVPGYGALQVDDAQVGGKEERQHVAPRFRGTSGSERLVDPAPEHHVAGERQRSHPHRPY
jgi:hypothetical protein